MGPPGREGAVTSVGSGIDRGHSKCPRSFLPGAPGDDDGSILGRSADFVHIHNDWLRKVSVSSARAPVVIRPTT
jgi:hypothetical protein